MSTNPFELKMSENPIDSLSYFQDILQDEKRRLCFRSEGVEGSFSLRRNHLPSSEYSTHTLLNLVFQEIGVKHL